VEQLRRYPAVTALIALSLLSVTIMVERGIFLAGGKVDFETLAKELLAFLRDGDAAGARRALAGNRAPEAQIAAAGLEQYGRGSEAMSEAMASVKSRLRLDLERNLGVLGTLGSNAPFIGLFGTVLGIVRSFRDLAANMADASSAVMAGIAEALIATAVGLLVAIPAVVAFNVFKGRVRTSVTDCQMLARILLSHLKSVEPVAPAAAAAE